MKRPSQARANARLRALVAQVHHDIDAHHARPDATQPLAAQVTCSEGCAHAPTGCCALIVLVERTEAEFIVARNPEAVGAARERLQAAARKLEGVGFDARAIGEMMHSKDAEARYAATYHALRLPCPFLVDRRCSIYRDRPVACRTHFALSPPALCSETGTNQDHITLDKGTRTTGQALLLQGLTHAGQRRWSFSTLVQGVVLTLETQAPLASSAQTIT